MKNVLVVLGIVVLASVAVGLYGYSQRPAYLDKMTEAESAQLRESKAGIERCEKAIPLAKDAGARYIMEQGCAEMRRRHMELQAEVTAR